MSDAFAQDSFTRPVIEALAKKHQVCPFEFSLDLALWVDCVICDYNYAFDPRVYLRRFFDNNRDDYAFLVDEAHNLPDRAREMFSAALTEQAVVDLWPQLNDALPSVATALSHLNRQLAEKRRICEQNDQGSVVETEPPSDLLQATRKFIDQAENWLVMNQPAPFRQPLLDFYFACNNYLRTAEQFSPAYVSYFELARRTGLHAKLFCLDPAPSLADPLTRSRATIFFSATLLPMDYYQQLLTASTQHYQMQLPSPFPDEQRRILLHNRISTKYANRSDSYLPLAETIEAVASAQTGNYLVFFPSYSYMEAVVERLTTAYPQRQLLIQERGMAEADREAFLARFTADNQETLLGFAVMGGIFGEGIDLVGRRLIGAVMVGVGLPQLCLERDLIRDYFRAYNNRGFEYAYQYPGLNRVMQAAGRVIRTEIDRGVIVLVDDRFAQYRYKTLFPPEWQNFHLVQDAQTIRQVLEAFWLVG